MNESRDALLHIIKRGFNINVFNQEGIPQPYTDAEDKEAIKPKEN